MLGDIRKRTVRLTPEIEFAYEPPTMRAANAISCRLILLLLLSAISPDRSHAKCAPDAAPVGPICADKYEASVWSIPESNTALIKRVQKGKATLANLVAGGASQLGAATMDALSTCKGDEYGASFPRTGTWTGPLYAVSLADSAAYCAS